MSGPSDLPARLRGLLDDIASATAASIGSLIDREMESQQGELRRTTIDALTAELPVPSLVIRMKPGVRFVINSPTAATLAACMRMDSTEAVEQKRAEGTLSKEDLESFGDVAGVICSGAESALRKVVQDHAELRLEDYRSFDSGAKWGEHLPDGTLIWYRFPLSIEDCPKSQVHIIVGRKTAELWNGEPLDPAQEIPQAPIRGRLAAYLSAPDVLEVVKKSCRRVGLELERYPSSAIPNPAAHRGELVLIDIPTGEERRFSWCRRLTGHAWGIKTVLIIHHPSRTRIIEAFRSRAHGILGWPVSEEHLSQKLATVLDETPSPSGVEG